MRLAKFAALLVSASASALAAAPAPSHPIVGTWSFALPNTSCVETYQIRADGTAHITSAEEVSESEFDVAPSPSAKGYYKLTMKVVKDNGKPDCSGETMHVGDEVTDYVQVPKSGDALMFCQDESTSACFGPLKREAR